MKTVKVKVNLLFVCPRWQKKLRKIFGEKIEVNYRNIQRIVKMCPKDDHCWIWYALGESPLYRAESDLYTWNNFQNETSFTPTRIKKFLKLFYANDDTRNIK